MIIGGIKPKRMVFVTPHSRQCQHCGTLTHVPAAHFDTCRALTRPLASTQKRVTMTRAGAPPSPVASRARARRGSQ